MNPSWYSAALLRLESVSLWGHFLSTEQLSQLFLAISETSDTRDLRLRRLNISGNDLSRLEADQLARSVVRLQEIFLLNTRLTTLQTELILARIVSTRSPLRGLYIGDNNLASVSPTLLSQAVVELQTVSLDDTNLGSQQVTSLLAGISQCGHTKLRHLDMLGLNIDMDISLPAEIRQRLEQKFKVIDGFRQIRLELI